MTSSSKTIYVGSFRHNLDAKNRLTIPSKWRFAGDEDDVYLAMPHPHGYVSVLPPPEVERLNEKVGQMKWGDQGAQDFLHRVFGESVSMGCDKQGRIHLPPALAAHASVEKETLLVGTMNRFSIWSPKRWDLLNARTDGESIGALMGRLDF